MLIGTQSFIAKSDRRPAGASQAETEICFIPFVGEKVRIEGPDLLPSLASEYPRPHDSINFLKAQPIPKRPTDGAFVAPVAQLLFPCFERLRNVVQEQSATQRNETKLQICLHIDE